MISTSARKQGRLWLENNKWKLVCEPHVLSNAKRIFPQIAKGSHGAIEFANTPHNCFDLQWFALRFPLEIIDQQELAEGVAARQRLNEELDRIENPEYVPRSFKMALEPRDYQRRAAELFLTTRKLLLADDVGLGKTCTSICGFAEPQTLPAVVVCLPHLARQWQREINRFMPELVTHVIRSRKLYNVDRFTERPPDVLIISYAKLSAWAGALASYCNFVVYDEIQELRRHESDKYQSAMHLSSNVGYNLGLSATPIYNYGGEIYNVMQQIAPGALGEFDEFSRAWCTGFARDKMSLKDPDAFGSFLREQRLMMRRTRGDVGRELPPETRITHTVSSDGKELDKIRDRAGYLARMLLRDSIHERGVQMQAASELTNIVRQATGIAKAPYVAEFVKMLLDSHEPVVLYGWHRSVYEVWASLLKDHSPAFYTGEESNAKKQHERDRFCRGDTNLLIVSLRAGAGMDGLQFRSKTVVFGELDWSPGVHDQCAGRVLRDGQKDPVFIYFLVSNDGSDPAMCETLGLKKDQARGLTSPYERRGLEKLERGVDHIKLLAKSYLDRR